MSKNIVLPAKDNEWLITWEGHLGGDNSHVDIYEVLFWEILDEPMIFHTIKGNTRKVIALPIVINRNDIVPLPFRYLPEYGTYSYTPGDRNVTLDGGFDFVFVNDARIEFSQKDIDIYEFDWLKDIAEEYIGL